MLIDPATAVRLRDDERRAGQGLDRLRPPLAGGGDEVAQPDDPDQRPAGTVR
jgi:hypothetical protein